MNVKLALFHACKAFRPADQKLGSGISAVARLIDMSPDVLQKKLSPTCETHHITLDEVEEITENAGIKVAAFELARVAGLACVPMPGADGEGSLVRGMSDIGNAFSALLREFDEAVQDNSVSPNECDRFQERALTLYAESMATLARMRVLAETRAPVVSLRSAS